MRKALKWLIISVTSVLIAALFSYYAGSVLEHTVGATDERVVQIVQVLSFFCSLLGPVVS